jgi:hypothetical protein
MSGGIIGVDLYLTAYELKVIIQEPVDDVKVDWIRTSRHACPGVEGVENLLVDVEMVKELAGGRANPLRSNIVLPPRRSRRK